MLGPYSAPAMLKQVATPFHPWLVAQGFLEHSSDSGVQIHTFLSSLQGKQRGTQKGTLTLWSCGPPSPFSRRYCGPSIPAFLQTIRSPPSHLSSSLHHLYSSTKLPPVLRKLAASDLQSLTLTTSANHGPAIHFRKLKR